MVLAGVGAGGAAASPPSPRFECQIPNSPAGAPPKKPVVAAPSGSTSSADRPLEAPELELLLLLVFPAAFAAGPELVRARDAETARAAARWPDLRPDPEARDLPAVGVGSSWPMSVAPLSSRRPWNDGWRSLPSRVHSVNWSSATSAASPSARLASAEHLRSPAARPRPSSARSVAVVGWCGRTRSQPFRRKRTPGPAERPPGAHRPPRRRWRWESIRR